MKTYISTKLKYEILGVILLAIIWQVLSVLIDQNSLLLPSPIDTIKHCFILFQGSYIYECIFETFYKMIIGFSISFMIAFVLGIIAGNSEKFQLIILPFISLCKSIPTASLVYLFILISGVSNAPIYIVVLISLPILYESVCSGLMSVDKELIEAGQVDGSSFFNTIIRIKLPLAIPYIILGIKQSFALAFKVEIMAEVITGSSSNGLGCAIVSAQRNDPTNMVPVFAYSLIAILIMLIIDLLFSLSKSND